MKQSNPQQIGVGIVGTGWMGTELMRRFAQHPASRVTAVCRAHPERGREVLDELGLADVLVTDDYDQLLASPDVDAVCLASPNAYHGPQSIAALEAGKHVFCEKPASITLDQHRRQVQLAQENPGLRTLVDYILYFDTFEHRLREMVAGGDFGRVTQFQINYRHAVNIAGEKAWKLDRSIMGDAIGMGINHAVSVLLFAISAQAKPVRVYATSMPAQVRPFEADPIWNLQITFDNGATGLVLGDIDSGNGYDAYHNVKGTEGGLIFDSQLDQPQKVRVWNKEVNGGRWAYPLDPARCAADNVEPWPDNTTTPDSGDVIQHQTAEVVDHFLQSILTGTASPLSFDHSAIVADVGWAAQESVRTGCAVDLT